jgi:hypothetical protein
MPNMPNKCQTNAKPNAEQMPNLMPNLMPNQMPNKCRTKCQTKCRTNAKHAKPNVKQMSKQIHYLLAISCGHAGGSDANTCVAVVTTLFVVTFSRRRHSPRWYSRSCCVMLYAPRTTTRQAGHCHDIGLAMCRTLAFRGISFFYAPPGCFFFK